MAGLGDLTWTPGATTPLPAPLPEAQAPAAGTGPIGVMGPSHTVGVAAHLPLIAEVGAFRQTLRNYLRSNAGRASKLNPGQMPGRGPLGQSTMGSNGLVGDPHVQTQGKRAGAIVQVARLGGREYHIYFHADGQREVIAMPRSSAPRAPAAPTGGTLAP